MTKIKVTYFKDSGKYYSHAEYESEHSSKYMWLIFDEVKKMRIDGNLPGLIQNGGSEFTILVECVEDEGYPALIR